MSAFLYDIVQQKGVNIMDMDKFYKLLTNDEEIADIPILFIFRVAVKAFEIINSGECKYDLEDI